MVCLASAQRESLNIACKEGKDRKGQHLHGHFIQRPRMPTSPTSYLAPPGILIWRSRYHIGFQLPLHHVVSQNSHLQVTKGPNIQHLDDRSRNQDILNDDVVKVYELNAFNKNECEDLRAMMAKSQFGCN